MDANKNSVAPVMAAALLLIACACGGDGGAPTPPAASAMGPADSIATAIAAVDRRVLDDPGNASLYVERARLQSGRDSLRQALADMERALAIDSGNVEHLLLAGDLHYATVDVAMARRRFQRAMELAQEDPRPA